MEVSSSKGLFLTVLIIALSCPLWTTALFLQLYQRKVVTNCVLKKIDNFWWPRKVTRVESGLQKVKIGSDSSWVNDWNHYNTEDSNCEWQRADPMNSINST